MALNLNEIKKRAGEFAKEWAGETRERAEAKSFWNEFFHVFGIKRRRVAAFEEPVKKLSGEYGFIDLFWKGHLVVEHKSKGKSLEKAYTQAVEYFPGLKEYELPKYVLVSDFARFRLYDLEEDTQVEFVLRDLPQNIHLFGFISGYKKKTYKNEAPANIEAAELMGALHDRLADSGYAGHKLEVLLVRLLFCLFAEDRGLFAEKGVFTEYIEQRTHEDGGDLGAHLERLFQLLNTPEEQRSKVLDESLQQFPYVNGKLFAEQLEIADFDSGMRDALLRCCYFDWTKISPAIFGSLFQSIMDREKRRNLGAHYTTEHNILKLIKPLFLDKLHEEFAAVKHNKKKLEAFHDQIAALKFFDPACGCGNFLIITYRELRLLEIEILKITSGQNRILDISLEMKMDVDNFYGIECEEFPARIAEVAMWLTDHQMNMAVSEELGEYVARLPLKKSATIFHGNALRVDWEEMVPREELDYILGNPPFIGHHNQSTEQKDDMALVYEDVQGFGVLDYVTCWYIKAAEYIRNTDIKVAFVSTNSIAQGEQVGILWEQLYKYDIKIHFAHRTFAWSSEAKGKAQVFVVIIGFGSFDVQEKLIFEYETPKSEAHEKKVKNINPYLVEARDLIIRNRTKPLCDVPAMKYGSKPTDGGNFLFTDEEKKELLRIEPNAKKFIKPFLSAKEFLHNEKRWCLWLVDIQPHELKELPKVAKRVQAVKEFRASSKAASTRNYPYHTLFRQVTQPNSDYILVPCHSSESRKYIPLGFFDKSNILNNSCFAITNATLFHFGVLTSEMHTVWVQYTCGRLKSDFRYSKDIVYNNFPWPPTPAKIKAVEAKAEHVLDIRDKYPDSSLADLYHPLTMPPDLVKAHNALDTAVDTCYTKKKFSSDTERIEFLFELYGKLVKNT